PLGIDGRVPGGARRAQAQRADGRLADGGKDGDTAGQQEDLGTPGPSAHGALSTPPGRRARKRGRVRAHSGPKAAAWYAAAQSPVVGCEHEGRGSPLTSSPARALRRSGAWLLFTACLLGLPSPLQAQDPTPSPEVPELPPDELDFQGLTSITLGSGARAFGMGGAFLARADDATAASWNPAGLSYLRNPEVSIVGARNSFDRGPDGGT